MMRIIANSRSIENIIKSGAVIVLTAFIVVTLLLSSYSEEVNKGLAENLVRLHVVANSDSPEDQDIKRNVRDRILEYMKTQLNGNTNAAQTSFLIRNKLGAIEELASAEVVKHGKSFPVEATLGSYPFPTKTYGDISLPAGNYQALRVVIGSGAGANWWCVIFPPLCFVDVTHGTFSESAHNELKAALTDEEYRIVARADNEKEIPVKIKFKIVELFQDSKIKFAELVTKLFNN